MKGSCGRWSRKFDEKRGARRRVEGTERKTSDNNKGEFLHSLNSYIERHVITTQNLIPSDVFGSLKTTVVHRGYVAPFCELNRTSSTFNLLATGSFWRMPWKILPSRQMFTVLTLAQQTKTESVGILTGNPQGIRYTAPQHNTMFCSDVSPFCETLIRKPCCWGTCLKWTKFTLRNVCWNKAK